MRVLGDGAPNILFLKYRYRTPVKYSGLFFRMTSQTPQTIYREKADDEQISNPLSKVVFERTGAVCVSLAKWIDS